MTISEDCQYVLDRMRAIFPQLNRYQKVIAGGAPRDGYFQNAKRYTGTDTVENTIEGDIDIFVGFPSEQEWQVFVENIGVESTACMYGVPQAYLGHFNHHILWVFDAEEYWIKVQIIAYLFRGPNNVNAFRTHVLNNFSYFLERFYYDESTGACRADGPALTDYQNRWISPGRILTNYMRRQDSSSGIIEYQYNRYLKLQRMFPNFRWHPPH